MITSSMHVAHFMHWQIEQLEYVDMSLQEKCNTLQVVCSESGARRVVHPCLCKP